MVGPGDAVAARTCRTLGAQVVDWEAVDGGYNSALCSRRGELLQVLARDGEVRVLRFGPDGPRVAP